MKDIYFFAAKIKQRQNKNLVELSTVREENETFYTQCTWFSEAAN